MTFINWMFLFYFPYTIALILEEIAIDSHNKEVEDKLLTEAQELHLQSLALARKAFGENNVQTAKHYGNLGRLYQSMHRYTVTVLMPLLMLNCMYQCFFLSGKCSLIEYST